MNTATIIRLRSSDPFCRIPNSTLQDPALSFKAKGILAYLLSKPDGWIPQVEDISRNSNDGARAIRAGMDELRELGYAELQKITAAGKVVKWRLVVADSQAFKSCGKIVEKPDETLVIDTEKPDVQNAHLQNAHLHNAGLSNNKKKERLKGSKTDSAGELPPGVKAVTGTIPPQGNTPPAPVIPTALDIYNAYPLKVGRPKALISIKKGIAAVGAVKLLALTQAFAAARGGDKAFCPHPATWFNQERYQDDPATWVRVDENAPRPAAPPAVESSKRFGPFVFTRDIGPTPEQTGPNFASYQAAWLNWKNSTQP